MEIRVLGTVELSVDGRRVDVGGPKPRALLALLALERGEAVTRDRLIEALWGDAPPGGVAHRLDVQMSRLRAVLRATDGAARVERENGGYVLRAEGVWVDAIEAQRLVADARRLLALGAAAQAHAAAEEALGLWRGRPLSELSDDPASQAIARRLEDLRLAALEARAEASLELGRHQSVLGELQLLAAEHPMHEPFHALLMLALQRCGREADALRAYDELQGRLREELGAVPGQSVRRVHEAILAPEPARTFEPPTKPAPQVRTSGRRVLIGAAAAAVALLALAAVHGERGPAAHVGGRITARVGADRVAFIDLRHGRVLDSFSIADLGPDDNDLPWIQGGDADWLASSNGTLLKIDPRRHRVARAVGLGIAANTMTLGLGSLWITDKDHPTILRLDPQYAEVQRRYRLPTIGGPAGDGLSAVAIAQGSVWVAQGRRRVLRIDPRSGRVQAAIPAAGAVALASGPGALWVAGGDVGTVYRIDPAINAVVARVKLDQFVCCVAVGGGYAWAMNYRVWKLSSDGRVLSSTAIDGDGANITWSSGALWVADGISGQNTRISPHDGATRTVQTGGLTLFASSRGDVLAVVTARGFGDPLAGVHGPVARIDPGAGNVMPDDPALRSPTTTPSWREQALDATCAGLLSLRSAPAPQGWTVAPDLADLPTSADRRTWTFRLRGDARFSPPSNAPVTAASMRSTIERALSARMGSAAAAPAVLGDLEGLAAFRAGKTDHIRGLRAHGNTLIVRLRAPAADLPLRMTSRALCAVPPGTPPSPSRFTSTPIPAAGPYYLARHIGGVDALLRPNPNYRGPRRPRLAAVLYEEWVTEPGAVDQVVHGRAELAAGVGDTLQSDSEVARRFAADTPGRPHWTRRPLYATRFLQLGTHGGPLAQPRLRTAVRLALDRRTLAGIFGDQPTARVLPPGAMGAIVVPVPRADPARARSLVPGRRVTLTYAGCDNGPPCAAFEAYLRRALHRAHITMGPVRAGHPADLTLRNVPLSSPDPLAFLASAGGPPAPTPRPAPSRTPTLAERIDDQLSSGTVLAFGTPTIGELASPRLGCRQQRPFSFGDDLAALCPAKR